MIQDIVQSIRSDQKCTSLFQYQSSVNIWDNLEETNSEIHHKISNYIQKFGARCTGELKLETITYQENPILFIDIIQAYIVEEIPMENKGGNIREDAMQNVSQQLRNPLKKQLFFYILRKTRQLVSGRENMRFERTRAFAIVRKIFTAIGQELQLENKLNHHSDIFYLSKEEIFDYIEGCSLQTSLKKLVAIRKAESIDFGNTPKPADRIKTFGSPYISNDFSKTQKESISEGAIEGLGCSHGIVSGEISVVHDPKEGMGKGDILVATCTDPGWITLFPSAKGIIVERGSLLSHSAIVSRELGIPCIVQVENATSILKNGDRIEMDGNTGKIVLMDSESSENHSS